jgi:hypothetical protein
MSSTCFTQWIYDAYIATGSTDVLELPFLTYKITRSANGSNSGLASKNYNNIFDKTVLNLLQEGDTIAVQSAKYIFERRR